MTRPPAEACDPYVRFAAALTGTGLVTDPWVDGAPRFRSRPLRVPREELAALHEAAERVAGVYHELVELALADPALLEGFFGLTPVQRLLWASSAPLWHGLARADVFVVEGPEGPRIRVCELNCDTPSGAAEAVVLGPTAGVPPARDPNTALEGRFVRLVEAFGRAVDRAEPRAPLVVGIVYPTEIPDDLALVELYERWCRRAGHDVVLGSPFNLQPAGAGGVALFGRPCDVILRHYKTDWWGERLPVWDDEPPFADPDPLDGPLALVLGAQLARRCAVLNPFASVLPQNKRAMAFMWEAIDRFSPGARAAIRAYVPESVRLEAADVARLAAEKDAWVLKSDYGCEGEEVVIGPDATAEEWEAALAHALPRRWIAQRYFSARRDGEGQIANHGVFLAGGRAVGLYARLARGPTDGAAVSVPVEVSS
jgi:hypothetical protein